MISMEAGGLNRGISMKTGKPDFMKTGNRNFPEISEAAAPFMGPAASFFMTFCLFSALRNYCASFVVCPAS